MQLATGYMVSSALYGVTSLAIPDLLQSGPKSIADLAAASGSHEDSLYRVMRALACTGLFWQTDRTFALTPASELLCKDHPQSMRALILWWDDPFHFQIHSELSHSIRTGETIPEKLFGLPCFDYLAQNKVVGDRFNEAMTGFSATLISAALDAYDFSWLAGKTLVDIAGGHGMALTEILKRVPTARGILFDLEHVVSGAAARIESQGVSSRCRTAHGDFFKAVPSGDAYLMKHIVHDWDDAHALTILRNIHSAASADARLLLIECVLAPGDEPHFAKWLDVEMLTLPGGRERTEEGYRELLGKAGFHITRVVPTKSPVCVIESVRQN